MKKLKNIYNSRSKNFWALEFSYSLHFIALSISAIFIPVIMLRLGFSISDVILYYIIFHFLDVLLHFFSKKFIEKFGLKITLILGTFFASTFFITYIFLEEKNWTLLILMAVLSALYDSFYYTGYFFGFMRSTEKIENAASNNIILNILTTASFSIGPLIGAGLIFITENKKYLLLSTIVFFLLSFVPLLQYKRTNQKIKEKPFSVKRYFANNKNRNNFISLAFYKISEAAESTIWPIFIYLSFKSLDSVAFLSVIAVVTSLVFIYFSGNIKKENREKAIAWASVILILIWLARYFSGNEIFFYLSSVLTGIFAIFISVPVNGNIFRYGEESGDILTTAILRNAIGMFAKLIYYISVFLFLYFTDIKDSFILIIFSLLILAISNIFYLKKKS